MTMMTQSHVVDGGNSGTKWITVHHERAFTCLFSYTQDKSTLLLVSLYASQRSANATDLNDIRN